MFKRIWQVGNFCKTQIAFPISSPYSVEYFKSFFADVIG